MTTAVKMKPIIFSPTMAQAIYEGRKTMTRRIMNPQPKGDKDFRFVGDKQYLFSNAGQEWTRGGRAVVAKYQPGDVCYVREAVWSNGGYVGADPLRKGNQRKIPSIHMPQNRARSFVEVTAVRCERIKDISDDDARAEGMSGMRDMRWSVPLGRLDISAAILNFADLWNELHGPGAWQRNYWVFVYQFRKVERP